MLVWSPPRHRECKRKGRAPADLSLDLDPAPVQFDELLGERQPEAGALLLACLVAPHLAELLEDGCPVLGGDADAAVGDGNLLDRSRMSLISDRRCWPEA